MSFVHLHVHSEYSLLDGFSNLQKLTARAKEMGMPAIALTDHGTMFGVIDFYNAALSAGVKPLIGVEIYLAARSMKERDPQEDKKSTHLLLLAENETGYKNLLKIASAAQLEGFYYYPRIDHDFLAAHAEGLICASGCMAAEIPRSIARENLDAARRQMDWYFSVFGRDRFFLELQHHEIPELNTINKFLLEMGPRYRAQYIATNDVHYINPADARLQDILLAIQTGCVLSDPKRMRMTDNSYYLRTPEEMARLFAEVPEALSNTLWIAERCNLDLGFKGYHLPPFAVPEGHTPETYLRQLCEAGLQRRYGPRTGDALYRERLEYELGVIHKMGFDTYFLIVWDLCRYARQQGIWYNARGSAAGSIVAYTLDITLVDPIEHGLIFERFLNPGRISMPDIDLDFRDDRRAEMLEYTARKYGDDKVAQIITFGTLGARAAIRDVGRVMDIPIAEVDKAAKLIPNIPGKPVSVIEAIETVPDFKKLYESAPYFQSLIDTASLMEGVVRNAGTHAAGVIITDKPVIEYLPLHRPTGQSAEESPIKAVTQFELNTLEALGLLKVDFLGLDTLTIMARACDLIRQRHGMDFNLDNIPTDDAATYELMGHGETAGVFQVEGAGMRRYLMQMKPKELANVIAMVALFRPGPMEFIPGYIRRMHGEEKVEYRHAALEPIFKETYGYPVYQEQLMFAVMQLAGYTAPEADDLRRAVAKKIKDKLLKHREKFVEGAKERDIPPATAEKIFDDWEEFARYGFNRSHAADYGVIAVQTAYLKAHYPVEYMTALLSVKESDTGKVAYYVADCRRMGIEIFPPDVNNSAWDFTIEPVADSRLHVGEWQMADSGWQMAIGHHNPFAIRFGLGAVKNVGQGPVEAILQARLEGAFTSINDFAHRVDLRQVGKRALESLVKVGALDRFGSRPALLEALDRILSLSAAHFRAGEKGQMSMFGAHTGVVEEITLPKVAVEVSRREQLDWERELIGLYVSDHPLSPVMNELHAAITHFSGQLSEAAPTERVRVAGLITHIRPHQTKTGKAMGFVTIEDIQGVIELVVFPNPWEKYAGLIDFDKIILAEGRPDAEGGEPKVLVDRISNEFKVTVPASTARRVAETPPPYEPRNEPRKARVENDRAAPPPGGNGGRVAASPPARPQPAGKAVRRAVPPPPPEPPLPLEEEGQVAPPPSAPTRRPSEPAGRAPSSPAPQKPARKGSPPPPPPDPFPPDWSLASALIEAVAEPEAAIASAIHTAQGSDIPVVSLPFADDAARPLPPGGEEAFKKDLPTIPPYLVAPATRAEGEAMYMITLILRPTSDKVRDQLRIRQIYGTLIAYPGRDRFAFHVFESGRGFLIEFPNFTTRICPEMLDRLKAFISPEYVRVEPITFQ